MSLNHGKIQMTNQANANEDRVYINLISSLGDPVVSDPAYQQELRNVSSSLHEAGISFSQRGIAFDSAHAVGYPLGEYFISLAQIAAPIVTAALVAWIHGRAGRKVKLKVGDIEIEATTQDEVDALLKKALKAKAKGS